MSKYPETMFCITLFLSTAVLFLRCSHPGDINNQLSCLSLIDSVCTLPPTKTIGQRWFLVATTSTTDTLTRIWHKQGLGVVGATSQSDTLQFDSFAITDTGNYFCVAFQKSCAETSGTVYVSADNINGYRPDTTLAAREASTMRLTVGRRVRLAWLRGGYSEEGGGMLVGYDTKSGNMHPILASTETMWINSPHILTGGRRIIFTNTRNRKLYKSYIINWDGSGLRHIADGECSDIWVEPVTSREWAIVRSGGADVSQPIMRYDIDGGSEPVLLWNKTNVGSTHSRVWYQSSADGSLAVGCFPFGAGSGVVKNGALSANGDVWIAPTDGCWHTIAPDNSYYWFHMFWDYEFNGHTGCILYRGTILIGSVYFNARGRREEHFHTKFSANNAYFVVATVGYVENASSGSNNAEVVLGRFAPDYLGFSGWVQITSDSIADYCPDAWIGVDEGLLAVNQSLGHVPPYPPGNLDSADMMIHSPQAGETFFSGETVHVEWSVADSGDASGWLIEFSVDDGLSWNSCNRTAAFPAGLRTYALSCDQVLEQAGTSMCSCLIKISDYFNQTLTKVTGPVQIFSR